MSDPRPLRVMVVEDDAVTALDLAAAIEADDTTPSRVVCTAASAPEALVGARESEAEVAFVDANLVDGRTGPEIAELLEKHFGLVVVLATADPDAYADANAPAAGILMKPFTPPGVRDSLAFAALRRAERARRR